MLQRSLHSFGCTLVWKGCTLLLGSFAVLFVALGLIGCGGHEARTLRFRTALDEGSPQQALVEIDKELDVQKPTDLPSDIQGDNALLVLDRGSIQQSVNEWKLSERDFEAADKAIDMLDLAHNAGDSIGEYVFSGSSGKYQAPPYEKLLINTLDMINYLENHDLSGAKIEARRLAVMQKYFTDSLGEGNNAILGVGGLLAGFAFEKGGETDEALRWYDEAIAFAPVPWLRDPIRNLLAQGSYTSPKLRELAGAASGTKLQTAPADDGGGDVFIIIGYGRVPHKVANRLPIGLALTLVAGDIHPNDYAAANKLAAQGLVTWVNYPSLGPDRADFTIPTAQVDGQYVQMDETVNISQQVRAEWKKIEGKIILSAITRLIARFAVGEGVQHVAGNGIVGFLASLGTQATLTALDTPDTRSWETLPARVAAVRLHLPAGDHPILLDARGVHRQSTVHVEKGGWTVVSLMALR